MALGPQLTAVLKRYGLESLTTWASNMIIKGASEDEVALSLWDQQGFKDRFWMLFAREKAGLPAGSPEEVITYEDTMTQAASAFGLTVTRQQMGEWYAADKSVSEMQDRMTTAARAVYQAPQELRNKLQSFYGIGTGDLVNYWLDPKKTLPELQRRFAAADIAAQAQIAGFNRSLSSQQAESLYDRGLASDQAREAFGGLVEAEELFVSVDETEQDISLEDQLKLITGDTDVAREAQRRGEKRAAKFQEGGGFASGKEGLRGLGSAAT